MFNGSNKAVLVILVVEKSKFFILGPNQDRVSPYKIKNVFQSSKYDFSNLNLNSLLILTSSWFLPCTYKCVIICRNSLNTSGQGENGMLIWISGKSQPISYQDWNIRNKKGNPVHLSLAGSWTLTFYCLQEQPVRSDDRSRGEDSWWPAYFSILPQRSVKTIPRPIKTPGCWWGRD